MSAEGIIGAIFTGMTLVIAIHYFLADFGLFPNLRARLGFNYPPPPPPPPPRQLNDLIALEEQQLAELRLLTAFLLRQNSLLRQQIGNQEILIEQNLAWLQVALIALGQPPAEPAFDILDLDHLDLD
jgi:hypothetical protein